MVTFNFLLLNWKMTFEKTHGLNLHFVEVYDRFRNIVKLMLELRKRCLLFFYSIGTVTKGTLRSTTTYLCSRKGRLRASVHLKDMWRAHQMFFIYYLRRWFSQSFFTLLHHLSCIRMKNSWSLDILLKFLSTFIWKIQIFFIKISFIKLQLRIDPWNLTVEADITPNIPLLIILILRKLNTWLLL